MSSISTIRRMFLVAALMTGGGLHAQDNPASVQTAAAQSQRDTPTVLQVTSLQVVHDAKQCSNELARAYRILETAWTGNAVPAAAADEAARIRTECENRTRPDRSAAPNVMRGAGDVIVSVGAGSYDAGIGYQERGSRRMNVFFNGFKVTDDAELVATSRIAGHVFLQYHLKPGKQSNPMWAAMIRHGGMLQSTPLHVSFGWDNNGPNSEETRFYHSDALIAVTGAWQLTAAIVVPALLLFASIRFAMSTSLLRNTVPTALAGLESEARKLKQAMGNPGKSPDDTTAALKRVYADYEGTYPKGDAGAFRALEQALRDPVRLDELPKGAVVAGLALLPDADPLRAMARRMSFSLARVQLFCWFMFAVLAGVFLCLVYSELPQLDNSMLALIGISAATAGSSWTIDRSDDVTGTLSQGFFFDLVTGIDNEHKIYRFQAVLVNMVLLAVGIGNIVSSIAYPVFDQSWLIFLGISGATYVGGKEVARTPTPVQAGMAHHA